MILVRVWTEGELSRLRGRILSVVFAGEGEGVQRTAASVDEILVVLRELLEAFQGQDRPTAGPGSRRTGLPDRDRRNEPVTDE